MKNPFEPKDYWEKRLTGHPDLRGTGHHKFDLDYNYWLYQTQRDCLDELVSRWDIKISGKRVLDVGSGIGFYIEYFRGHKAGSVTGLDITKASRDYLKKKYPDNHFLIADISDQRIPIEDPFDIISAMGVLYHIVEATLFQRALTNICNLLAPGGYLLLTDSFNDARIPSARHARLRSIDKYQQILEENNLSILELLPLFYYSNRPYIPWLGPWILRTLKLGRWLYRLDRKLRHQNRSNRNGLKILLARKEPSSG